MTKLFFSMLLVAASVGMAQAGNPGDGTVLKVKTDKSSIAWTGKKVTGQHNGSVNIKEGNLILDDGLITGGNFTIDMNSITVLDLQDKGKASLEGHLKSDDFFGVTTYPDAKVVIKEAKSKGSGLYDITADLTIKGITNTIQFPAQVSMRGNEVSATADIKVDRSLYNVRYGSGKFFEDLGDKTIYDEFELKVTLVAGA
jgi:polyisoprenoid-binding protein YceI